MVDLEMWLNWTTLHARAPQKKYNKAGYRDTVNYGDKKIAGDRKNINRIYEAPKSGYKLIYSFATPLSIHQRDLLTPTVLAQKNSNRFANLGRFS